MTRVLFFLVVLILPLMATAQKTKGQKRFESDKDFGSVWKQKDYKITVETDFDYLRKGQYLYMVSAIGDNKMDLPESWLVKRGFATDSSFVLELSENKRFETSRYFMSLLDGEILRLEPQIGMPDEELLIAIWEKYNGRF